MTEEGKGLGKSFKINLWGDRLLIEPAQRAEKTSGGIIIPSKGGDDKPLKGTIVGVGKGTDERPLSQELLGRQVMYSKFAGSRLKLDGEEYLILRETDIWADVEGEVDIEATDSMV